MWRLTASCMAAAAALIVYHGDAVSGELSVHFDRWKTMINCQVKRCNSVFRRPRTEAPVRNDRKVRVLPRLQTKHDAWFAQLQAWV